MATTATRGRVGLEAAIALVAGAAWFTLCSVVLALLPHSPVVVVGVVVLDVVVVLAIARHWGISYAVPVGVAGVVAVDWYYIPPTHALAFPDPGNAAALAAYLVTGVLLGELAVLARRRAEVSEGARSLLAGEQAALRRVATLVAREASPPDVFAAVTEEVGRLLAIDIATLLRYETDGTACVVGAWSERFGPMTVGTRITMQGDNVAAAVLLTGEAARHNSPATSAGPLAKLAPELGVRSGVGCPVVVDGRLWGVMVGASASAEPLPTDVESRLEEFTELAATAVANAQARAELAASRSRIVATADQARRQIERDLHDGVQQRLVSLGLGLRAAEDLADSGSDALPSRLADLREGLLGALDDLREISHGIHPAILSEGGLRPALGNLARRSPVPVELDIQSLGRLPEPVEVGLYYVISEALANVSKHAHATHVHIRLETDGSAAHLDIRDDGVGGADPGNGSGLIGLTDRVHTLEGTMEINSPTDDGTTISVVLPVTE